MLAHDTVDRGQAEASPVTVVVGGEERLEDALAHRLVHADAMVRELQTHILSRFRFPMADPFGAHRLNIRLDEQQSAVGHGFVGVYGEVDQHAIDLIRVQFHEVPVRTRHELDGATLTHVAAEFAEAALDNLMQRLQRCVHDLLAAEGHELGRQVRRPLGQFHDPAVGASIKASASRAEAIQRQDGNWVPSMRIMGVPGLSWPWTGGAEYPVGSRRPDGGSCARACRRNQC